jgi:hypothetical protein
MKRILTAVLVTIFMFWSVFASEEYVTKTPLEAANFLAAEGIITDWSANPTEYRLLDTITRQEVMKIVAKLSGEEVPAMCDGVFWDVDTAGWGCKYIEWALKKEYIAANDNFRPNDNITKTEAMKLVLKVKNISKTQVTDNWQEDYMMTAYEYGIIEAMYSDYNADATRGWIFQITTATIEQEEEIKIKIEEKEKLMSDEAAM